MFNMLSNDNPDDSSTDDDATTITHTAAAATAGISTLGQTYAPNTSTAISSEIATAIQQLSVNQTAIMQQMATMTFTPPSTAHNNFHVPPVQSVQIPSASFQHGRGGRRVGSRDGRGRGQGGRTGRQRTPFANHMRGGQMVLGQNAPSMVGFLPFSTQMMPHGMLPPVPTPRHPKFSNTTKQYVNWNICFTCGFDVEEGHTSATCPLEWRKPNH